MSKCPCFSGKDYNDCCMPVIEEHSANTALALMRSRYTAWQTGNAEYLMLTSHPANRKNLNIKDIEEWSDENNWTKLEIISAENGRLREETGIVEFKAYYTDKSGKEQIHHEKSRFLKVENKWYYVDGLMNPPKINIMKKVSRNDPCPCGSGKKHKKCCGAN